MCLAPAKRQTPLCFLFGYLTVTGSAAVLSFDSLTSGIAHLTGSEGGHTHTHIPGLPGVIPTLTVINHLFTRGK